ncbi:MAG: hypothetical protein LBD41_06950 [Clostridiales Family XIII bacterium]|nr:hypothetical protein [Clostridiales Family XIII bacterium]
MRIKIKTVGETTGDNYVREKEYRKVERWIVSNKICERCNPRHQHQLIDIIIKDE